MENAKYQWGNQVVAVSDIINDGSYPNKAEGELIVSKGEIGRVRQIGQDEEQTTYIYIVEFGDKLVGCFEDELDYNLTAETN